MAKSSWPGVKQLKEFFQKKPRVNNQHFTLPDGTRIEFAENGTLEYVVQCKRIRDFWQRMRDDAMEAYKEEH